MTNFIRPCATSAISDNFAAHKARGSGLPGTDFRCATGERIWAAAAGTVTRANTMAFNGKNVRIAHADGSSSYYLHLSRIDVGLGQAVAQGQVIGLSGSTGRSTGPHLHFSIANSAGVLIDPQTVMTGTTQTPTAETRTVKLGSRGSEVVYLQKRLGIGADGIFGPLTRRAVINFQKSRGLAADGIVGPKTWKAIG
jgi:murein DD-endopeptidase MepM/ murein hydrolase activator NlpD